MEEGVMTAIGQKFVDQDCWKGWTIVGDYNIFENALNMVIYGNQLIIHGRNLIIIGDNNTFFKDPYAETSDQSLLFGQENKFAKYVESEFQKACSENQMKCAQDPLKLLTIASYGLVKTRAKGYGFVHANYDTVGDVIYYKSANRTIHLKYIPLKDLRNSLAFQHHHQTNDPSTSVNVFMGVSKMLDYFHPFSLEMTFLIQDRTINTSTDLSQQQQSIDRSNIPMLLADKRTSTIKWLNDNFDSVILQSINDMQKFLSFFYTYKPREKTLTTFLNLDSQSSMNINNNNNAPEHPLLIYKKALRSRHCKL